MVRTCQDDAGREFPPIQCPLVTPCLRQAWTRLGARANLREERHHAGPRRPQHEEWCIITIGPDATAAEAVARMVENNVGSLPVVEPDGCLVGVISERDLIRELHDRGEPFARTMIRAIMTLEPVTCDVNDEVEAVMGVMSERRIAKVPVIDRGRLAGIVSVGDVVKLLYEQTRREPSPDGLPLRAGPLLSVQRSAVSIQRSAEEIRCSDLLIAES